MSDCTGTVFWLCRWLFIMQPSLFHFRAWILIILLHRIHNTLEIFKIGVAKNPYAWNRPIRTRPHILPPEVHDSLEYLIDFLVCCAVLIFSSIHISNKHYNINIIIMDIILILLLIHTFYPYIRTFCIHVHGTHNIIIMYIRTLLKHRNDQCNCVDTYPFRTSMHLCEWVERVLCWSDRFDSHSHQTWKLHSAFYIVCIGIRIPYTPV